MVRNDGVDKDGPEVLQEGSTLEAALEFQDEKQAGIEENGGLESMKGNRVKKNIGLGTEAMGKAADPGLEMQGELESNLLEEGSNSQT